MIATFNDPRQQVLWKDEPLNVPRNGPEKRQFLITFQGLQVNRELTTVNDYPRKATKGCGG